MEDCGGVGGCHLVPRVPLTLPVADRVPVPPSPAPLYTLRDHNTPQHCTALHGIPATSKVHCVSPIAEK